MASSSDPQAWIKSTHSGSGDCVQWRIDQHEVRLRDSKNPEGPELSFTTSEWSAFLAGVKQGEADLLRSDQFQTGSGASGMWLSVIRRVGVRPLAIRQTSLRPKQFRR